METINLSIDGKIVDCPPNTTILKAAEMHGIKIPSLCDHPDLKPFGACRICLVEDQKSGRLMASCVTPAASNMIILTRSARITKHRLNIVRLMMAEHPESCIVCSKGNRCRLRQLAADLGIGQTGLYPMPNYKRFEQANPFIIRDLSKCILCGKCIRADHELVVVGAIDYNLRGFESRPATVHDQPLEASNCTFCGTCLSICPTGALSPNSAAGDIPYVGTPDRETSSICGFCGVGCSLTVGSTGNRVVEISPSHLPDTVNRSTLCIRGHFTHDFLYSEQRLTRPLIRKDGQLAPAEWDEALDLIARRVNEIKAAKGNQSVAFLGSSKCSNEENYLFQKLIRTWTGTNNIDNGGFLFGQPVLNRFEANTGGGSRVAPLADLDLAEAILVLGANPCLSMPVVGYTLKRAARNGIPLIVADPRKTELTRFASLWLCLQPQTDLELLNGLAALLLEYQGHDRAYIERYTDGYTVFQSGLKALDHDRICRITGLGPGALDAAARLLKGKKIAFVVGQGILNQKYGQSVLDAALNLSLATGSLGSKNAGIYFLSGENNQNGAADMGSAPGLLPGRLPVADQAMRNRFEMAWNTDISPTPGLNLTGMIDAAEKRRLSALYIMGENPLRALPEPQRVQSALEKLDFIVVQDILLSETAKLADVILPGAASYEKGGSFTNLEGRIQVFSAAVLPPADAKPDWQILDRLSSRLTSGEPYGSIENIRSEISQLVPMYEKLNDRRQGWIKTASSKLVFQVENAAERIDFHPIVSTVEESDDADYPFMALLETPRCHLGCGTRTSHSHRIQAHGSSGDIELSFEDAAAFELADGDCVTVSSPFGELKRNIIRKHGARRQLYIPLAVDANEAMKIVGLSALSVDETPGWKTCRVRLSKSKT